MSRKPTLASLPPSTATSREHRLLAEADFVRRTARALLRDAAEAEDLAQDTLLIALSRPPRALSRAWLRRVLWTRATRRYAPPAATGREELLGSLAARGRGPETDASRVEACEALHDALARLAPDQRELIRLLYFEGLTARTAARRLGIPHETVRTRRRAALARLRRRVETRERGARLSLGLFLLARPWRAAGRNAWAGGFLAAAVAITALAAGLSGMLGRAGHGAPTRPDDPGRDVQAALGSGLHPATRAPRATRALAATDDAPPSAAGEGQTSALSGRVTDTSGDPLAGAEVFATSGPDYRVLAVTDAAGRYTAVLPDEAQWLGCTASGHGGAPGRHRLDPALGGDRPVDFVLTPSAAVPVRGRVVDACGLPIEGATVRLVPHRPLQDVLSRWQPLERGLVLRPAVTDARGEFMLERGGMRAHVLHVEHPSYSPLRVGASSALREAREIALLPRARVEGLLRRPDGSPAAGATVRVVGPDGWPRKVAAGPDGAFACDAPAGTVSVRASLPESDATWIAAGEVDLAEAGRARWDAELRPDGAVPGTLRSSAGEPLAGWRVVALADGPARSASLRLLAPNQADAVATTGADGRFLIGPLFAADGALFFEDPEGRFPAVRATYRRAGKSLDVVADERAAELTGSLAPELLADGPVELWAHSHAWLQPRRVELGSSGSFRVRGLPAGRCELVLWQAGLCPRSAGSWYLAPGELLSLPPLPGARPATLRVRVQAPALFPDWGVVVMAFRPRGGGRGDRLARVRADDAGRAEIPALAGEPLRLEIGGIRRARLIHHVQPEELARGEELALSFPPMQRYTLLVELPPTPVATDSWRLRVLDEAGNERLMQERPYRRIPRRKHLLTVALPDGVYDVVCELGTRTATFDDVEFVGGSPETVELALRDEDVR